MKEKFLLITITILSITLIYYSHQLIAENSLDQNADISNLHSYYRNGPPNPNVWEDLPSHQPIKIYNDTDFINQASINGWPGNGTKEDPYIISTYAIDATDDTGVFIENVNLVFIIQNVYVRWATNSGFLINISPNAILINNSAEFCIVYGFEISSDNVTLQTNYARDIGGYAYGIYRSNNGIFISNVAIRAESGFSISETSENHYLRSNLVINASGTGIYVDSGSNWLELNIIINSKSKGIRILSNNNTIVNNLIAFNDRSISLSGNSKNNYIYDNILYRNDFPPTDSTQSFLENVWDSNLYDDYSGSGAYIIYGDKGSIDNNPIPLSADLDGDGLADLEELEFYSTLVFNTDSDGDGILDGSDPDVSRVVSTTSEEGTTSLTDEVSMTTTDDTASEGVVVVLLIIGLIIIGLIIGVISQFYFGITRKENLTKVTKSSKVKINSNQISIPEIGEFNVCCYQSARLKDRYCAVCGRVVPDRLIEYIDKE